MVQYIYWEINTVNTQGSEGARKRKEIWWHLGTKRDIL